MTLTSARPRDPFIGGFFDDAGLDFETRGVLGHAVYGAAEPGEVLAALAVVADGDHDAWAQAWRTLGGRVLADADAQLAAGHRVSACGSYLRAATYLGQATNALVGAGRDDELLSSFRDHRRAWEAYLASAPLVAEAVQIPYEGTTLPGYLVRPVGDVVARRTLVMTNGSDGSISDLVLSGGIAAHERGYTVLVYDGPGQQSMLFERKTTFRPDWEAVLTPVVDFALTRAEVDGSRIAHYAISQGGYWLPRALTAEHRAKAAIADPGVVDVSTSWTGHLPPPMMELLAAGKTDDFDSYMSAGMSPEVARLWAYRAAPYGQSGYAATVAAVQQYRLGDAAASITTPLLVTSPEGEQFWPGQSEQLVAAVSGATLVPFTQAEGANLHCQPMARALTDQRMLDWLDGVLG